MNKYGNNFRDNLKVGQLAPASGAHGSHNSNTPAGNVSAGMSLHQFLSYFDFDYDIVSPGGDLEDRIRKQLLEDGDLDPEYLDKNLICLIDRQNAYFGDIDKERYPVEPSSVQKIIDRMDAYINDSVISEFEDSLDAWGIDSENMDLSTMVEKCKEVGVGTGEVSYLLAGAILDPSQIHISEVNQLIIKTVPSLDDQIGMAAACVQESSLKAVELEVEHE